MHLRYYNVQFLLEYRANLTLNTAVTTLVTVKFYLTLVYKRVESSIVFFSLVDATSRLRERA